jgi:hypothetical protein
MDIYLYSDIYEVDCPRYGEMFLEMGKRSGMFPGYFKPRILINNLTNIGFNKFSYPV